MSARALSVEEIGTPGEPIARGLTLAEAFTRVMALAGRDYAFTRTARLMHLVLMPCHTDDPIFDSSLAVDSQARDDIMAQVCAHGLGQFRVTPDKQFIAEASRARVA